MSKTDRRNFLISNVPLMAAPLLLPLMGRASALVLPVVDQQEHWRYCEKCHAMFYNGYPDKGHCPAGEGHQAEGYNFSLPYGMGDLPETATRQIAWRYCDKCHAMFYNGYMDKGRCPAGGGHNAQGYIFRLPHDISTDDNDQGAWRYCQNCHVMFYDGYSNKGACAAGGGHSAQGYQFVLPHKNIPDKRFRVDVRTDGWAPIGGWVEVFVTQDGDAVFSGHIHNSGALDIKYTLGVVLMTPSGQGFGFANEDHKVDGTQTLINRKRDDDWRDEKSDPAIGQSWDQILKGKLGWRLVAADSITQGGVVPFLVAVADDIASAYGGTVYTAGKAVVKLVSHR